MKKLPTTRYFRKPDGRIMLRYRWRTNRVQQSTQLCIDAKFWDEKAQRPIRGARQPELLRAGHVLNELAKICDDIFIEFGYGNISQAEFKEELQQRALSAGLLYPTGWVAPKQETEAVSFMRWVDMYIELQRPKVKGKTMMKYGTFKGFLNDFIAHRGMDITFDEIGKPLRDEVVRFFRNYKAGTQVSHCNKLLQQLKQFAAEAYPLHHNNNTFIAQKWAIPNRLPKQRPIYLSPLEIQAISGLKLKGKEAEARDLFLVGLYTGQRVSDYWRYRPEHFRNDCLDIHQVKGKGERVVVPLDIFPQVTPLLEQYNWASPRLADTLDSTAALLNRAIKEICKKAGIDESITRYKQIADLPPSPETSEKWSYIGSHTARRSFATILYNRGYTLAEIMPMTGHEKESTLMKYIGTTKEENARRVQAKALREQGGSPIRKAK